MEAGHGGASGRFQVHKETALEYAFLLDQANILDGNILSNPSGYLENLTEIRVFPVFVSKSLTTINKKNIFLSGDALFAFPPSFAQGASQSIEAAFELFEYMNKNSNDFNKRRIE